MKHDDLYRVLRRAWREHLAPARGAHRPVGEAIRAIERSDDVAGPHDRDASLERVTRVLLAERLHRPVGRVADLLGLRVGQRAGGRAFVVGPGEARIDRDARDEQAETDVRCEQLRRHLHVFRNVTRVVDDHVPAAAAQRTEISLAVAEQRFDARGSARGRLAAVEMCHPPAPLLRFLGKVRADEARSTENQQCFPLRQVRQRAPRRRRTKHHRHLQQLASARHGTPHSVSRRGRPLDRAEPTLARVGCKFFRSRAARACPSDSTRRMAWPQSRCAGANA